MLWNLAIKQHLCWDFIILIINIIFRESVRYLFRLYWSRHYSSTTISSALRVEFRAVLGNLVSDLRYTCSFYWIQLSCILLYRLNIFSLFLMVSFPILSITLYQFIILRYFISVVWIRFKYWFFGVHVCKS